MISIQLTPQKLAYWRSFSWWLQAIQQQSSGCKEISVNSCIVWLHVHERCVRKSMTSSVGPRRIYRLSGLFQEQVRRASAEVVGASHRKPWQPHSAHWWCTTSCCKKCDGNTFRPHAGHWAENRTNQFGVEGSVESKTHLIIPYMQCSPHGFSIKRMKWIKRSSTETLYVF